MTAISGGVIGDRRIESKGKRTHGHGQQGGDYGEVEEYMGDKW